MTILEMLEQSGILTLLGLGIVFGFLIIMVVIISLVGKIISEKDYSEKDSGNKDKDTKIIAAISAAVSEHRKTN